MTHVAGHTVVDPADEIRSEKWRGVIFLKDGTHLVGERIFDSYEELAQTIEECSREWRECASQYPGKLYVVKGPVSGQRTFLCVDFSHVIPIPYKQP